MNYAEIVSIGASIIFTLGAAIASYRYGYRKGYGAGSHDEYQQWMKFNFGPHHNDQVEAAMAWAREKSMENFTIEAIQFCEDLKWAKTPEQAMTLIDKIAASLALKQAEGR